jgi:hypothetical protein
VLENDVLVLLEEGAPKKIQLDVVKGCSHGFMVICPRNNTSIGLR